ncbi:Hsp70 family protein [Aspergillus mulundensis]|uniref:Actin-like ATPase domain-containing protein n=1 Tax=Aspergillus mulundensis TaxID=1810919 RepID=A0A3D8RKC8_9EURO|nr:Uncharacterized protein DSM5745_06943 [Aspergillus mulundensis]RDW74281.1 Uncharacterized protein DSM5745_06943 [Aspergillus mulundensis]
MADRIEKIIVGVDYGTTFTGASFVSTQARGIDDIVLIHSWPGEAKHHEVVLKTPSRIAYDGAGNRRWGFQVKPGMNSYSWTKLLLDTGSRLTNYDADLEGATALGMFRLPEDKDAVEVAGDFLSGVYRHILRCIAQQRTEEALSITPLEFWFTVPAIWSDEAKHATLEAARCAGFGSRRGRVQDTICLIPEPEAAAIAVLRRATADGLGFLVKPDDGVLICDCGGGTVDITTYLVKEVWPTLKFEELCTGIGAKCGSTAIDRKFYNLMGRLFGKAFTDFPRSKTAPGSEFMNKFEVIKRDFGYDSENTTHELSLNIKPVAPDPAYFNADENVVVISDEDLRGFFDPVIEKILALVHQQINAANRQAGRDAINRIILVGGFGNSEYLRTAFRNSFDPAGNIAVTVPNNAQAAIVQGAALRGLEGLQALNRRCRRHYGFESIRPFRKGFDDEQNAFIHRYYGTKYVGGHMTWVVGKGQILGDNFTSDHRRYRTLDEDDDMSYFKTIYSCDSDIAPSRRDHDDVRKVGKVHIDLEDVDITQFPWNDYMGERVYHVKYDWKMIFGAREGVLKFEAYVDGQAVGKTSIDFNKEPRW